MKPVYLLEEHHEAFFVWQLAEQLTGSPLHHATLLHVDAHADMDLPVLSRPLGENLSPDDAYAITYRDLDIQTFITAAVYQQRFSRVEWLRPQRRACAKSTVHIWSQKGEGCRLFMGTAPPFDADGNRFEYRWFTLFDAWSSSGTAPLILDIDLDFFAGGGRRTPALIEVTAEEYRRIKEHPRHPLRSHFGNRVRTHCVDGRTYFSFSPLDGAGREGERERTDSEAEAVIAQFGCWLRQNRIDPAFITISRSWQSGFTGEGQWKFLEETLLRELAASYGELGIIQLDEVHAQMGLGIKNCRQQKV
jgi:hypothetical protein